MLTEALQVYIHIKGIEEGFTNTNFLKEYSKKKGRGRGTYLSLLAKGKIQFLSFHQQTANPLKSQKTVTTACTLSCLHPPLSKESLDTLQSSHLLLFLSFVFVVEMITLCGDCTLNYSFLMLNQALGGNELFLFITRSLVSYRAPVPRIESGTLQQHSKYLLNE